MFNIGRVYSEEKIYGLDKQGLEGTTWGKLGASHSAQAMMIAHYLSCQGNKYKMTRISNKYLRVRARAHVRFINSTNPNDKSKAEEKEWSKYY